MTAVRRLFQELVERRLWPIALALVVAAVAIPVLVGSSSSAELQDSASLVTAATDLPSTAAPAVELVGPPAVRSRPGKVRDPFRRTKRKAAKPAAAKKSAQPSPAAAPASPKSGGASAPRSSGSGTTPAKPKRAAVVPVEPAASIIARSVFETTAHFTGPHADYEHPLDRLAVLGSTDSPALQYLGVSRGGEYAIFLLGPAATARGEAGACIVADPCRAIGLRRGEKLSVEVADAGVATRRYTLEVTSLRRVALASDAAAQREREHVAEDGREVLRSIADDVPTAAALGQLRYGPATGTVTLVGAS